MVVVEIWEESSLVRECVSERKVLEKTERERVRLWRDVSVEWSEEMDERSE